MKWLAYCAPGRRLDAALTLMLRGEQVTEVAESPVLTGSTDIVLVNPAMLDPAERFADIHFAPLRQVGA